MIAGLFCDRAFWMAAIAVIGMIAGITGLSMRVLGYRICAMDFFPFVSRHQGMTLIPVSLCIMMAALRNEFHEERVVKYRKLNQVWQQIYFKIMVLSFVCAILYTVALCLCGKLYPVYLWDRRDSMMFYFAAHVMVGYSYWKLVGEFLWVSFLNVWLFGGLAGLCFWLTRHPSAGILVSVTLVCALDYVTPDFYKQMILRYEEIRWNTPPFWRIKIFLPALAMIFLVGFLVRKRDFLRNEKQIYT